MSLIISAPRYKLLRKIYVVMMTHVACWFIDTSPVTIPTEGNFWLSYRYFWLLNALIGDVYMTFLLCFCAKAIPYYATTVLPADVWAATKTLYFFYKCNIARFWN